jgi:hypothetical protein
MRSKVRALVSGTICAVAAAAVLNHFSCIGACEPAPGAAAALQLPLAVVYALLTAGVVLPLSVTLAKKLGSAIAPAVMSCVAAILMTLLFYRPEVDTLPRLLIPFGLFFAPWFIGSYVSVRMWPNKQFQPTQNASGVLRG